MSGYVAQAPGWWPSLVQVACSDCGYRGPVVDLNERPAALVSVRLDADAHHCGEQP